MNSSLLDRVKITEERLSVKLPEDYIDFLKTHEGKDVIDGNWFKLEEINTANEYLDGYNVLEDLPEEVLKREEWSQLITLFSDNNGGYIVIDLRKNGLGVFFVFPSEDELEDQFRTFSDFVVEHRKYIKTAPYVNWNYLDIIED